MRLIVIAAVLAMLPTAQAQVAGNPAREQAFNAAIEQARAAPGFKENRRMLDVFRATDAAGLPITLQLRASAGETAFSLGLPMEAEAILRPIIDTGEYGGARDSKAPRNRDLFAYVVRDADLDRTGKLDSQEASAVLQPNGELLVILGTAHLGDGKYAKAIELIEAGIAKGRPPAGRLALGDGAPAPIADRDYAKLTLGIAQYRAGRIADAQATWTSIRSISGAEQLARAWMIISGAS